MASTDIFPSAASFYVHSLPTLEYPLGLHPTHPLNVWAGLLDSDPGAKDGGGPNETGREGEIFFMLVNPRRQVGKQRLIFWFNGGPGCSSFDGAMMEMGPFRMDPTNPGSIKLLDWGGWEEFAGVVFVDQPPGTGFSYSPTNGYLHELHQASAHLIHFMQNFYKVFPEWSGVDTYLAGESYAGQYIPYFADAILSSPHLPNFPLKGIAIGNGWIDPRAQYPAYADFAYQHNLVTAETPHAKALSAALEECQKEINLHSNLSILPQNLNHCQEVMNVVTDPFVQEVDGKKICMNVYDIRLVDDYPACGMNWPPELPDLYTYLRRADVVSALHASKHKPGWVECNSNVGNNLWNMKSPASVSLFPGLLDKIQVLLFAGDQDLICNHVGIEKTVEMLEWQGEKGFGNATEIDWFVNGAHAGTFTTARNLTYVKIAGASHMVSYDQPQPAHDMILRFMDVDFSLLVDGTPSWGSRLGDKSKATAISSNTTAGSGTGTTAGGSPAVAKLSSWEAFYNAASTFIVLGLILLAAGLFFVFRARRRRTLIAQHLHSHHSDLPLTRRDLHHGDDGDEEERQPLGGNSWTANARSDGGGREGRPYSPARSVGGSNAGRIGGPSGAKGKGKGRRTVLDESESEADVLFELGDDDEEDDRKPIR